MYSGLALAPWNALGQGRLRTDAEDKRRRDTGEKGRTLTGNWERSEDEITMSRTLEKIALEVGAVNPDGPAKGEANVTAIALAYVMQKTPYVFPIIGGRKIEHLMSNIEALKISLSDEQIDRIEAVVKFDLGFPHTMVVSCSLRIYHQCEFELLRNVGYWQRRQFLRPFHGYCRQTTVRASYSTC